jgi:excisionase family DNA binding protein
MSGPITTAEAAARLGVSVTTVHRLVLSGDLPYLKKMDGLRGGYLFDASTIALYARQHPPRGRGRPPKELAS